MEGQMKNDRKEHDEAKKDWHQPELIAYGSVEKITLKGFGIYDGGGLSPKGSHPSM